MMAGAAFIFASIPAASVGFITFMGGVLSHMLHRPRNRPTSSWGPST
jgi:hypothetical protein